VTGCTKDSFDRFWAGEAEGLEIHRCLTGARQYLACELSTGPLLRLSGRWAEGSSIVVVDGQSVKSERFLAAYSCLAEPYLGAYLDFLAVSLACLLSRAGPPKTCEDDHLSRSRASQTCSGGRFERRMTLCRSGAAALRASGRSPTGFRRLRRSAYNCQQCYETPQHAGRGQSLG
jgi:hypothetical protein